MTRRAEFYTLCAALAFIVAGFAIGNLVHDGERHHAPRPAWADLDHDGQSTRVETILRDCSPVRLDAKGRKALEATCVDLYTGAEFATDTPAQSIQIDHLFPQSVARERWAVVGVEDPHNGYTFEDFYNDPLNLQAVRSRTNGQKGDRMPQEWCPADPWIRPLLAERFRQVTEKYRLPLKREELAGLSMWDRGDCAPEAKVIGGGSFPPGGSDGPGGGR